METIDKLFISEIFVYRSPDDPTTARRNSVASAMSSTRRQQLRNEEGGLGMWIPGMGENKQRPRKYLLWL